MIWLVSRMRLNMMFLTSTHYLKNDGITSMRPICVVVPIDTTIPSTGILQTLYWVPTVSQSLFGK